VCFKLVNFVFQIPSPPTLCAPGTEFSPRRPLNCCTCCLHAGSKFKIFLIFNLFYLRFCFGPDVCPGNFIFKICGVVPWHCSVRNIILLHTHILLSQHFTNNFPLHTTQYSHVTPSWTEKELRLLSFVPVYRHALLFPVCFSWWGIENFYMIFPYTVKERVTKTEILNWFS
jgi:hypothetical protein